MRRALAVVVLAGGIMSAITWSRGFDAPSLVVAWAGCFFIGAWAARELAPRG